MRRFMRQIALEMQVNSLGPALGDLPAYPVEQGIAARAAVDLAGTSAYVEDESTQV